MKTQHQELLELIFNSKISYDLLSDFNTRDKILKIFSEFIIENKELIKIVIEESEKK